VPFALPHAPRTICGAEQLAVLPPFGPAHVQVQVLLALFNCTALGVPGLQLAAGIVAEGVWLPQPPGIGASLNVAVTVRAATMLTVQTLLLPLQSPPQPEKEWVASLVAVRVTVIPEL
jgi:hypothetical protein